MSLLATLLPMLKGASEFRINLSRSGENLRLTLQPILQNFEPDTEDQELAARQAALICPIVLTVPASPDPDQAISDLLAKIHEARLPAQNALEPYIEQQRIASEQATAAAAEKAKKAADKAAEKAAEKSNKPLKAPKGKVITKGAPSEENQDAEGEEGGETLASSIGPQKNANPNPTPDMFGGTDNV